MASAGSAVMLGGLFCLSCAARCGPVRPASPLSLCLRCCVGQCTRRCCAPHRSRGGTSPVLRKCWSVRWCADMASARWRIVLDQPSPTARPGCLGVRGSCGTHPLRPPASLLHNAAFCEVCASRCAKAPLGAAHRFAPSRVHKTGVMQSGLRWSRSHSRRRFPVACTPYAPPSARPCGCRVTVASSGAARCVVGQWPAASHVVCAPAHPYASPLRGISPARWSARPPPVGAPSARAPLLLGFATGLVACNARNTGATGLTACKPA